MNEPLVSVTIPAYNHAKYVREAIASIIAQSYKRIELLVLNDGSTDDTWEVILSMREQCEARFERVWFETQENRGTRKTNNRLLQEAHGKYVYLIASDDRALPDAIRAEAEFLEANPDYALVTGDNEFIDADGTRCYWGGKRDCVYDADTARYKTFWELLRKTCKDYPFGSYPALLIGNHVPNGYLIRRSIFDVIGFYPDEAKLEDYWLMLQISKYARLAMLPEPLFEYRWHGANTAAQAEKMKLYGEATLRYEQQLLANADTSAFLPEVQHFLRTHAMNGDYLIPRSRKGIPWLFEKLIFMWAFRIPRTKQKILRICGFLFPRRQSWRV